VSNPLFLASGPVLVHIKNINYRSFNLRFKYFYPYLVLGFFLYQFVSIPLIKTFFLIENMDALSTLIFAIIFELFVYANFAGLSLMIYAIAGFLGYRIPLNFRQPFSATNIIDFWKGWHISLSMTLKAIFYDPARKTLGSSAAILIVFISSAMWHGVSLNFLIWGVFHALIFISTIWLLKRNIKFMPFIVFILAIVIGRLVFLDSDFDRLLTKLHFNYEGTLVFNELLLLPKTTVLSIFVMIIFVFFEFLFRKKPSFVKRNYKFYRTNLMAFMLLFITLSSVAVDSGVGYAVYGQR
jgi:D-alanyl-lipoteichoic acid acyltransferase DltB (MBOAT superfamily)